MFLPNRQPVAPGNLPAVPVVSVWMRGCGVMDITTAQTDQTNHLTAACVSSIGSKQFDFSVW